MHYTYIYFVSSILVARYMSFDAINQYIDQITLHRLHSPHQSVTRQSARAIAAVLRRMHFTWHTARLHTQSQQTELHIKQRLHHCIYAANSGTGTAAAPVSVLTSRSIAVVFIHPLSLLHLPTPPAQVPADCLHASRVGESVSCASLSAGRISLGSPETFRNSTWTKTNDEI